MTHSELKNLIHERKLILERMERLVSTDVFEKSWAAADKLPRINFLDIVCSFRIDEARAWLQANNPADLGELSRNDLKEIARHFRIPNWSRLSVVELIAAIEEKSE